MTRGYSLEQDLKLLINNPKYSDIEILCKDEAKLYGCRAVLAARSEVLDRLLYNGMKETYEKQISFPEINASGMKIILEYVYTGSIDEESLTKDNIVEAFHAADYFQLLDLKDFVMKTIKNASYTKTFSPELLSKVVDTIPLSDDNILINLFVEDVALTPLNTIEFGRLSIKALQYLLSCTHGVEKPFATPEYEVFRYSAILAAKQVSNDAYKALAERLQTLEQIDGPTDIAIEYKHITDYIQKVAEELEPLVKFIDFNYIRGNILTDIIEPLNIIPSEIILNIYRQRIKSNNTDLLNGIRGIPNFKLNESKLVWDKFACGPKLTITDNRKVVQASNDCNGHQNVRTEVAFDINGIFEWDVIIEKVCGCAWVGVCAPENINYGSFVGHQPTGWVLGSSGYCYHNNLQLPNYCPPFGDGTKITVHLDMSKKTIAFTVNGTKHPEVSGWSNLPSKLYPVVSLCYPGCFRIQPHKNA